MKKNYCLFLSFLFVFSFAKAQKNVFWKMSGQNGNDLVKDKSVSRLTFPKEFKLYELNIQALKSELFKIVDNRLQHSVIISLPNVDGNMEEFEMVEASNFEPALQQRYPDIRAFSGKGITDKFATLKLSFSPQGIQTMVFRTGKENEFIEPYSADHLVYAVFNPYRTGLPLPWNCSTPDAILISELNQEVSSLQYAARSGGDLKTMRLAQSVTAEYSNYFGATSSAQSGLVLAAVNNTLTRCNGVYEKDLALHLNLIANTTDVFYYTASTDPYSAAATGAGGAWNSELQNTLTSVIGEANYDVGHLFGATGGGGNAGCIGCICTNGSKGSGYTSPSDGIPSGDNFDIDYVVHEIGHQLGGNHTFSHANEGSGVNKEVGSGITIMGYAGITSQDVTNHSIPFYHQASIGQIQTNLGTKTCPVTTSISANNATPVVASVANFTIPISTPFALTGSATDANGDPLTYSWEQNDNASGTQTGASSIASVTKATGPNFLSFSPTTSPIRYFPRLATILTGGVTTGPLAGGDAGTNIEALSSVARTLNFRLTVRDNAVYSSTAPVKVGQTQFTDMVVTVSSASGPFAITVPNTNVSWAAGSTQTVTWNVASTTATPVSCANVKISLSEDGGQTFPYVLAASTPNDGSEVITMPTINANATARIKVEAVGNIFFDISNTNFTVTAFANGFEFSTPAATNVTCASATTASVSLGTTITGTYSTSINLTASGNPVGTTVSFSTNPLAPGNATTVTLNNVNTLSSGSYTVTITGVSGSITKSRDLVFVVGTGTTPSITTQPANQNVCAGTNATFTAVISGTTLGLQWQQSSNGTTFTNISGANSATYTVVNPTSAQNGTFYRLNVTGQCNSPVSNIVTLTIGNAPSTPVITPSSASICNGSIQSISASATLNNTYNFGTQAATNSASTSAAGYPAPYSLYYGGQRMQMLIRASELTAAGFVAGSQLNNIQFPVVSRGTNWGATITALNNFKVSIGNTALTTLSTFQTGLTTVVAAANFTPLVGYNNTHTFSSGFTWDGTSNLIVETTFSNNITGGTNDLVTQYNSPAGYQSTIVYRADGVTAAVAAGATTVNFSYTSRPDFKLNGTSVSPITWSPITNLYTDAGATTAYTGTSSNTVYVKSTTAGTLTYTANASGTACNSTAQVNITVSAIITAPTATNASRCGTGTLSLSANSSGNVIDWYADPTGGVALATGSNTFTTPSIAATTIYYAEARNSISGCISATRTPVTATVNSIPALPNGTNGTRCGTGTVLLAANSSGNVIDWYSVATGGTALLSGSDNYTTSSLSISTDYYAEARNVASGCISSSRTTVSAIINTTAIATGTNGARCGTGTVLISSASSGNVIDWYAAPSGGTALSTANNNFTTPSIAATTLYYAEARNTTTGCISSSRTVVTATVNAVPSAPAGTNGSRCNTGTVSLSASSAGNVIDWYAASTGGSALLSGSNNFTTPSISSTTIYFTETRNATTGCISASRTAVTATINTTAVATGTNGSRCGTGTVLISATSSGNVIDWYAASTGGTALVSGSNSYTTPSISTTTIYYAEARNVSTGCLSATRTAVTATVNITTVPTGSNNSRCGTGTVLISATSSGNVIDWYAASTGGTALLSGSNNFTTPSIAANTTYYAGARNTTTGCLSASRTAVIASVNAIPSTPAITAGGTTTFCNGGSVVLTSSSAVNNVWSTGATTQSITVSTSGNYTVTVSNASGCTATSTATVVTVNACSATLDLKLFLQGYYTGTSTMNSTLFNLGLNGSANAVDTITVNLWSPALLNNASPSFTQKVILQKNGTSTITFPAGVSGNSYYIAVKHRNHFETWSAAPVPFTTNTSYDFSTGTNKAYGDGFNPSMRNLGGNVFGFYSGDANNDGSIDGSDLSLIENGAAQFEFGYNKNDVTGDGATDGSDLSIIANNALLFLFYARP